MWQKKIYCVTNKICTNKNEKEKDDLDVSRAEKKHDKVLKAAYSKPPTKSVLSTPLELASMSISTTNQYPVCQSHFSLEEVHMQLLNEKGRKQSCIDSLLSPCTKKLVTCVIIS